MEAWWKQPLRIIQPNLQVKDTGRIDPERLAKQLKDMHANTVVFNVGGIYAWYRSDVPYHHVNEFLPSHTDLLADVIQAFHRQGLRFVARLDLSKAKDEVYLRRPEWFVRDRDGEPEIVGAKRPGEWSLLMSTCINGGYRNEEVAVPILNEILDRYDIDGVFFNNPQTLPCGCQSCQDKYTDLFGVSMPESRAEINPAWWSVCLRHNMELLNRTIKSKRPDVPVISYYGLFNERLEDRRAAADLLCTEPQDVLSSGHQSIPEFWKPALSIKLGRSNGGDGILPLGIVHSCPGMDWRHTGLPPAEYAFWLSQIPANGGQIWHSLTGVPDTIRDKRILQVVGGFNRKAERIEQDMHHAESAATTALLWCKLPSTEGWADGLLHRKIPFDILPNEQAELDHLTRYRTVIVPDGYPIGQADVDRWKAYVEQGGRLIVEGVPNSQLRAPLYTLLGAQGSLTISEPLVASYLRFEGTDNPLQKGMELTELIAHRGRVAYFKPVDEAQVLATLVPPFSPLESVGAPPERASLPVERTDLPLAVHHRLGQGSVLYLPFSLSGLIRDYRLGEHYLLLGNALGWMLGEHRQITVTPYSGLQINVYRTADSLLIHYVNGTGRRPLDEGTPLVDVETSVIVEDAAKVFAVEGMLENGPIPFDIEQGRLTFCLPEVRVWEVVKIGFRSNKNDE